MPDLSARPGEPAATLQSFAEVRRWLMSGPGEYGRVDVDPHGAVMLYRPRCTVAVVQAGKRLPDDVDVLLIVGPGADLADALGRVETRRVQFLVLPSPAQVAERVVSECVAAAEGFAQARVADQLLDIGRQLNSQRDPAAVLEQILVQARRITGADAGSIYLLEDDGEALRFKIAQNDSVQADFSEFVMPVTATSIVGSAVLTKKTVRVADLYGAGLSSVDGRRFTHDRSFDERFGYQTRSILTTPMITPDGEVLAVIQLINAKEGRAPLRDRADFEQRVRPFSDEDEHLAAALAGQAATALENASMYAEIEGLFEGFVRASVHAIEQRDPTTSGHSQRVADLTVGLARVVDRSDEPRYAELRFGAEELREIEYAGLLHDFGKVGVREEVLVKARKLYDHELALIEARFDHMRTALQLELLRAQREAPGNGQHAEALQRRFAQRMKELDELHTMMLRANEPSVLPAEADQRLRELAQVRFRNIDGEPIRILEDDALDALMIPRGSLTSLERQEIQRHVTHTYNFLVRIPWGSSLSRVPDIAVAHHEYLDGSGYPSALPANDIPVQARMMTVSDIFDALTAADRPYKKAVPLERALDILHAEAKAGKVDFGLLRVFIEAKVYETVLS